MRNVDYKIGSSECERNQGWTFITNHAAVLLLVAKHPRITAREISHEVGITERMVRLIIGDLDRGGYISRIREGRGIFYQVNFDKSMRHRTQRGNTVRRLLSTLVTSPG